MSLTVIMYHYVRNPEESRYKGIKGVREATFIEQVKMAKKDYYPMNLVETLDYLNGQFSPKKPPILFTFDDGLKEHGLFVTEVLAAHNIQGLFFLPTAPIEEQKVLPVHKNHYLLASLDIEYYQKRGLELLHENYPDIDITIDPEKVKKTYRWDTPKVASFKYLINYILPKIARNEILQILFEQEIGTEQQMAEEIYITWPEARKMQEKGMLIGGHSHNHQVLSSLNEKKQYTDLAQNKKLLENNLIKQSFYPFAYPFGKKATYTSYTIKSLEQLGYHCAFNTEVGKASRIQNIFELHRFDPKDLFSN